MSQLPAAAVPVGAVVRIPFGGGIVEGEITQIVNASPKAGSIEWTLDTLHTAFVRANLKVEIVSLPN